MNSRLRTIEAPAAGAPPAEAPGRPGVPSSRLSDGALICSGAAFARMSDKTQLATSQGKRRLYSRTSSAGQETILRDGQAERLGGLEIDDKLKVVGSPPGPADWPVFHRGGCGRRSRPPRGSSSASRGHRTPGRLCCELPQRVDRRQPSLRLARSMTKSTIEAKTRISADVNAQSRRSAGLRIAGTTCSIADCRHVNDADLDPTFASCGLQGLEIPRWRSGRVRQNRNRRVSRARSP